MTLKNYKIQDDGILIAKNELEEWYDHYTKLSVRLSKDDIEMAMFYAGMAGEFCFFWHDICIIFCVRKVDRLKKIKLKI